VVDHSPRSPPQRNQSGHLVDGSATNSPGGVHPTQQDSGSQLNDGTHEDQTAEFDVVDGRGMTTISAQDETTNREIVLEFDKLKNKIDQLVKNFFRDTLRFTKVIADTVFDELFNFNEGGRKVFGFDDELDLALGQAEERLRQDKRWDGDGCFCFY
jgi:hypothetical protein